MNYFPEPYTHSKCKIKVELFLSNYATKSDLKMQQVLIHRNQSSLKSHIDKLGIDKLENAPVDLNLRVCTFFLKFLKKRRQFCCTGLLPSNKLVHLDGKNLACFTENVVQKLKNLVLSSKSDRVNRLVKTPRAISKKCSVVFF